MLREGEKLGFECRHSLADAWEEEQQIIVLMQSNPESYVFDVRQVDDRWRIKVLHYNDSFPETSYTALPESESSSHIPLQKNANILYRFFLSCKN